MPKTSLNSYNSQNTIALPSRFFLSLKETPKKTNVKEGSRAAMIKFSPSIFINYKGMETFHLIFPKGFFKIDFKKLSFVWVSFQYEIDLVNFFVYDSFSLL